MPDDELLNPEGPEAQVEAKGSGIGVATTEPQPPPAKTMAKKAKGPPVTASFIEKAK